MICANREKALSSDPMRESDRTVSRRAFLRRALVATAATSAALIVGDEVFEALERLFPRKLVPGVELAESAYPAWSSAYDANGARGVVFTEKMLDDAMRAVYEREMPRLASAIIATHTPLLPYLRRARCLA